MLDAARTVFAQRGYHGASTAEIAARCGCSEPILYRHFPSKQALFAATLLDSAEVVKARLAPVFATAADPFAALAAVVEIAAHDELFLEVSRLRMLAVTLEGEPEIGEALRQLLSGMHERFTGLMEHARATGALRPDVDPSEAAWLWQGYVLLAGARRTLFPDTAPQRTGAALIELLTAKENHP